jgi:hypothetical protein
VQSKVFFFEKKKQKTLGYFGCGLSGYHEPRLVKVFWFFFSKKNFFLRFSNENSFAQSSLVLSWKHLLRLPVAAPAAGTRLLPGATASQRP